MYALPYLVLQRLRQAAINARRRDRTVRYLLWSAIAGVASALMIAVLIVPVVANPLVRLALVPAGYHRLAYHAARFSGPGADPAAYALCAAAWACRDGAAIAWVEARRERRDGVAHRRAGRCRRRARAPAIADDDGGGPPGRARARRRVAGVRRRRARRVERARRRRRARASCGRAGCWRRAIALRGRCWSRRSRRRRASRRACPATPAPHPCRPR